MKLQDTVAVITGASEGFGKTLAKKIALEGAKVILIARSRKKLNKVVTDIQSFGGKADFFVCDVKNISQIQKTVQKIFAKEKTIDILINNAGIWTDNEIEITHPQKRKEAFETNTLGAIEFTYAVLPYFKERNAGYIFNVISTSGTTDTPVWDNTNWHTYGATKWALTGFTNALRRELAKTSIKITGFFPGGMDTNLYENAGRPDAHGQAWMMNADDIADIVVFALTRPKDVLLEKIVVTKVF